MSSVGSKYTSSPSECPGWAAGGGGGGLCICGSSVSSARGASSVLIVAVAIPEASIHGAMATKRRVHGWRGRHCESIDGPPDGPRERALTSGDSVLGSGVLGSGVLGFGLLGSGREPSDSLLEAHGVGTPAIVIHSKRAPPDRPGGGATFVRSTHCSWRSAIARSNRVRSIGQVDRAYVDRSRGTRVHESG